MAEPGRAVCWGAGLTHGVCFTYNEEWPEGTLTQTNQTNCGQSIVPAGETFTQIAAGHTLTCGLRADGSVLCWGENFYDMAEVPDRRFAQISVGRFHTCGITAGEDQELLCWGAGTADDACPPHCGQSIVPDLCPAHNPERKYSLVSAGGYHSCALTTDGFRSCWGGLRETFTPIDGCLGGPSPAPDVHIDAGPRHYCGIALVESEAVLYCAGLNDDGQVGPRPEGTFAAVAAGARHSCGLRVSDRSVACWGADDLAQSSPPEGVFELVDAGGAFGCALSGEGLPVCWGDGEFGQGTPPETLP